MIRGKGRFDETLHKTEGVQSKKGEDRGAMTTIMAVPYYCQESRQAYNRRMQHTSHISSLAKADSKTGLTHNTKAGLAVAAMIFIKEEIY